ncbi:SusC/RagA family TonB-linked outer membrane protein [Arachidicoccus ginsenosidimutans]|uniref:SusC/RagA family TonB-linked outer membrane protein n=1 Tax=Arachidicoccus sp. BS20 TaxID=1850526 RepID=UPI000B1178AC|nr:TonB-dependent receptor [Arachidicoccus sp. BS20]
MKKIQVFLFLLFPAFLFAQQTEYYGQVVDSATGNPLNGATIFVKQTTKGTSTDSSGHFTISAIPGSILQISSVGYNLQLYTLGTETSFTIRLASSANELSQVVVVGYGTQRKIDVTGSVAQIKGGEIAKQGVTNALSGLQGKVAGVQITNNGSPGASPQVLIRGLGSFNGSTAPLYIVDGVWVTDINYLNPSDIDNVSILKDASSEAIYGVRGANGVVLITTKKGAVKGISVNYNGSVGTQIAQNVPKMANGTEYATLYNELTQLNNGTDLLDVSQFGAGTDWFDIETRHALITNHQISVNGGGDKSTYNVSLGYLDQDGILKTNNFKRYTASFNNDIKISNHFKFGYNIVGSYSKSHDAPGAIWRDIYTAPPIISPKNADGTYGDPGTYGLGQSVVNPQVVMDYNHATTQTYNLSGNAYVEINFAKHFVFHSSVGGTYIDVDQQGFTPVYQATSTQYSTHNTLTEGKLNTKNWQLENTLTYSNMFGDHRLTILLGQSAYRNFYGESHATAVDGSLSSDPATWYFNAGTPGSIYNVTPSVNGIQTYPALEKESSYFGRVSYSYKDRYSITGTLRSDGDSKFTGNSGRATLPSIGAAWIVSNEPFMKNQRIFDVLKFKGSWGKVGNSGIPAYVASQTTTTAGSIIYGNTGIISPSQSLASLVPPPLNWELGVGTNAGIEAAFLKNRLTLEADYYNKKTERLVFPVGVLASSGTTVSTLLENAGVVRNRGVEVTLNWHDNVGENWSYSIGVNGSANSNKFVESYIPLAALYSGANASTGGQLATITKVGLPLGAFYGYKVIGIFQNQAEIDNYKDADGNQYQPDAKPGDFKYLSTTGVGPISGNDRVVLGNPNPKYYYGVNTNVRYKTWDLSIDLTGVADVDIYNGNQSLRYGNENYTEDFYKTRWHGEGTSNTTSSADIGGRENYYINSYYVESGSYLRIRNIQLGYSLPENLVEKWHMQGLRFYVNAQNPFLFTKYKGFTPEISGESPGNMGIDYNVYPTYATYTFGVNLTF